MLYAEIRASANEAARLDPKKVESYARGFAAIHTLFPEGQRSGDIRMSSSQALTKDGGDIDLLTPAGSIILGVTQSTLTNPQGVGIQAERTGSIYSLSYGDVIVNRAAVHTLDGGDIVMWSTLGNIDAGKGAKTRRQIALPGFRTDTNGFTAQDPGSTSTGAGIGTLQATQGAKPGNVVLATPNGYVDAGDAGIRVSGDLVLVAPLVLNAANIQVQGNAIGLPTVQAPNIGGLVESSNTAGAAAQQALSPKPAAQAQPSIIIVEVIGYGGDDTSGRDDRERDHKANEPRTDAAPVFHTGAKYDAGSAVQILGSGKLSAEESQYLTPDERQQLLSR